MPGETIDKLVIQIAADVDNALRGINQVDGAVGRMDRNVSGSGTNVTKSTSKMSAGFAAVGTAAAAMAAAVVAAGVALGTLGVKRAAEASAGMEQYIITLKTLYGDQQAAADQMQWILDFAKSTPFEINGLVDATVKLKAFGLEAQDVLETLGDTAAGTSKPIDQVVNAFGRLSVGDTGQAVAMFRDIGVNMKNIQGLEWDARGSLVTPVEEALPLVQTHLNEKFGGLMDEQSKSLKGIVSNIQDIMSQAGMAFMGFDKDTMTFREGALFDTIKESTDNLRKWMEGIDFTSLGQSVESGISTIKGAIASLSPIWDGLKEQAVAAKGVFDDFFRGLGDTDFSGFKTLAKDVIWVLGEILSATAKMYEFLDEHDIAEKIGKSVAAMYTFISEFYNAIRDKVIESINLLIEGYNALVPIMQKVGMDVETVNKITFENIADTAKESFSEVEQASKETADSVEDDMNRIKQAFEVDSAKSIEENRREYHKYIAEKQGGYVGSSGEFKSYEELSIKSPEIPHVEAEVPDISSLTVEPPDIPPLEAPRIPDISTLTVNPPTIPHVEVEDIPPVTVETTIPNMNVFEMVVSKIRAIDFDIPRIDLPDPSSAQTTVDFGKLAAPIVTQQVNTGNMLGAKLDRVNDTLIDIRGAIGSLNRTSGGRSSGGLGIFDFTDTDGKPTPIKMSDYVDASTKVSNLKISTRI